MNDELFGPVTYAELRRGGAPVWAPGIDYVAGDVRRSTVNHRTYVRVTTGAGVTDPAVDFANWQPSSGLRRFTEYTGGIQTYLPLRHMALCRIRLQAAGGAGSGGATAGGGTNGGSSGAYVDVCMRVPAAGIAIILGARGLGSAGFGGDASPSYLGQLLVEGGKGGRGGYTAGAVTGAPLPFVPGFALAGGAAGKAGQVSGSYPPSIASAPGFPDPGWAGRSRRSASSDNRASGSGGDSLFGLGGAGTVGAVPGADGEGYGAGGSGGSTGGNGGMPYCSVEEFLE